MITATINLENADAATQRLSDFAKLITEGGVTEYSTLGLLFAVLQDLDLRVVG